MELDWTALLASLGLLGAAAVLVVLEVFVVSFGLLLVAAVACAGGSIWYAFAAHDAAGWVSVALIPVGALFAARWGFVRIRSSRSAVPKSEIAADAGYRHVAERLAVGPGSGGCSSLPPARSAGRGSRGASATCRYTRPRSRGGSRGRSGAHRRPDHLRDATAALRAAPSLARAARGLDPGTKETSPT